MVQLAVNKDGVLRGTYFDLEKNEEQPVHGSIDKQTQRVAWTVGKDSRRIFETGLGNLTNEHGPLSIYEPDGKIDRWTLARFEESAATPNAPPAEEEKNEKSADGPAKVS